VNLKKIYPQIGPTVNFPSDPEHCSGFSKWQRHDLWIHLQKTENWLHVLTKVILLLLD